MDAAQWPQGIGVVRGVECARNVEKKPRPQQEQALNCPRCNSTNTKFCYYNNYSLSQPRYFCKTCRRYWTEGGTLRNVPVGGSSRKNKRSSNISTKKLAPDLSPPTFSPHQNPKIHDGQDLSLSYADPSLYNGIPQLVALPFALEAENLNPQNPNFSSMRGTSSGGQLSPLISIPVANPNSVTSLGFKPSLSFSLDGVENRLGNLQAVVEGDASRIIFPLDESRPLANEQSNGYWSGMLNSW